MQNNLEKIIKILWGIKGETEKKEFLQVLFTKKELEEFSLRIDILRALKQGKTQREIAKNLGISITTVTRGNKFYKNNKDLVDKYF